MATKILMPQLGESVTEGTISKWLVKIGDTVNKYDPLAEVTTDKVNAEVPASVAGRITEILVAEGETVAVGTLIMYIDETNQTTQSQVETTNNGAGASTSPELVKPVSSGNSSESQVPFEAKQRYSPAVTRLAQEHQVDLSHIVGTGLEGRITRKDVQKVIDQGGVVRRDEPIFRLHTEAAVQSLAPTVTKPAEEASSLETSKNQMKSSYAGTTPSKVEISVSHGDQVIPVTSVRKTIASRMVQSKQDAPHAWTMVEVDVTNLVKFRNRMKDEFAKREGMNLTFLPFFIKAVVESLKEFPIINSTWQDDKILVKKDIHISIAVATEDALYVPVIKHADQKSIYGIAKAVDDLATRTREGKLTMDDMSGGTFTVNNTGSFGSVLSAPIINSPQAAILSMESIVKRPVVIEDMIAVRSMVNLCMSLDHRVLDGQVCGRFLQSVKRKLESIGSDTKIY